MNGPDPMPDPAPGLSRRTFLRWGGTATATGLLLSSDPARVLAIPNNPPPTLTFEAWLRRRADQLNLKLEFWNLRLATGGGPAQLEKKMQNRSSYLVVEFPPQAIAEQAFYQAGGTLEDDAQDDSPPPSPGEPPAAPPVGARLANPTRLSFLVPSALLPMPYTVQRLLSWLDLPPRIVANATPRGVLPAQLHAPTAPHTTQTAIELPWHLVLSPHSQAAWAHTTDPIDVAGRTELWHTRLAVRALDGDGNPTIDEADEDDRTVRAVWCTDDAPDFADYVDANTPPSTLADDVPFRTSLTRRDRLDIVRLSSDFSLSQLVGRATPARQGPDGGRFVPEVVEVDRLMLTSLGGYLDSSFEHELLHKSGEYNTSLLQWRHIAALGRDSYVRVVRKGFLFPYGFKAALVRITERRFDHIADDVSRPRGAYLRQRVFIVVLKSTRRFTGDPALLHEGRQIPFRSLTCVTKATPALDDPQPYTSAPANEVFAPTVGDTPFPFEVRAVDWAGHTVPLSAPVVWVDETHAYNPASLTPIVTAYQSAPAGHPGSSHPVPMEGRKVTFGTAKQPGDTTFVVRTMAFGAELADPAVSQDALVGAGNPGFYPNLAEAAVELSESGAAAGSGGAPSAQFTYAPAYLTDGFWDGASGHLNRGDVLFVRAGSSIPGMLAVDAKRGGGAATPAVALEGYSRELGPTGDPAGTATGSFDPAQVLSDEAKILGGIALKTVLGFVADFLTDKEKALKITSRQEENPNRIVTEIDFHPDLVAGPPGLTLFAPDPPPPPPPAPSESKADIHAVIVTNLDMPDASTSTVEGRLTKFVILLFGGEEDGSAGGTTFIRVPVQSLEFRAGSATKDEVNIQLGDITFHGVLAFVEELSSLLSFGDSGGLKIDVDGTGIRIELMVALPDITVGVMSLTNMAIFVALVIPFDGSPVELMFAFCSRENPFTLTVWIFGGGGFVGLTVSVRGVELFELAFEFGGGYAFSLAGLASGKVEAKAGIYFRVETLDDEDNTQQCTLEAYFRIAGAVSILGLITVSIEFYVSLSYTEPPGSLVGEARLTVEIDLTVWSTSVELTVRKELAKGDGAGGGFQAAPGALEANTGGPAVSWADLMTTDQWQQEYVTAYAPLGA